MHPDDIVVKDTVGPNRDEPWALIRTIDFSPSAPPYGDQIWSAVAEFHARHDYWPAVMYVQRAMLSTAVKVAGDVPVRANPYGGDSIISLWGVAPTPAMLRSIAIRHGWAGNHRN